MLLDPYDLCRRFSVFGSTAVGACVLLMREGSNASYLGPRKRSNLGQTLRVPCEADCELGRVRSRLFGRSAASADLYLCVWPCLSVDNCRDRSCSLHLKSDESASRFLPLLLVQHVVVRVLLF